MKRLPPACWRWKRRLSLFATDALEPIAVVRVETHLGSCPECRAHLEELRGLNERLRALGRGVPSVEPSLNLRRRWEAALSGSEVGLEGSGPGWLGRFWAERMAEWLLPSPKWWWGFATCWVLVLVLRISSPSVAAPAASTPNPSLRQVVSLLRTEDLERLPSPAPPRPEGAFRQPVSEGAGLVCDRSIHSASRLPTEPRAPRTTVGFLV